MFENLGKTLASYLNKPLSTYEPIAIAQAGVLEKKLKAGDVLLVEGSRRVSSAIKYLTQSTWSHSAICLGKVEQYGNQIMLVEADLENGVVAVPASKYSVAHTRICRPVGVTDEDIQSLLAFVEERVGQKYDLKNVLDLVRYLFPTPPVPMRWRRKMLSLGSGDPTRAICSTLIAEAFQSIRYPILPTIERRKEKKRIGKRKADFRKILYRRHHSLFTPRDFDVSPYFKIIKPTLESKFDYHQLTWHED
ncbi:MAG: YiiX/YebB-like N1pC/P60 family cysteine hydrolase [Gammaproteobacteria bacterium]